MRKGFLHGGALWHFILCCLYSMGMSAGERIRNCWNFEFASRGCFGCCGKPSNGSCEPKSQGQNAKQAVVSDGFWSTSTYEIENSALQSQRSLSSISISNPNLDPTSQPGCSNGPPEFVNHGLAAWKQARQQWNGNKRRDYQRRRYQEPRISWNATYENLLGTNRPFPQRIPLSEMVEFLVDVWEQEGMYD